MPVHYYLPPKSNEKGFCVATRDGFRRDMPHLAELSQESPYEVDWLWPGVVARGRVTLIEGPPDSGKSFAALSIAAMTSAGLPWPGTRDAAERPLKAQHGRAAVPDSPTNGDARFGDGDAAAEAGPVSPPARPQSSVVILARQDHLQDTVAERLERAGAQIDICYRFTHFSTLQEEWCVKMDREVVFPYDARALGYIFDRLREPEPGLFIIDPLTDYCPQPRMVDAAISRLNEVAAEFGMAIVATLQAKVARDREGRLRVRPKGPDDSARCVWSIEPDQDDPARRLLVPTRMSFCPRPASGLAFRIEDGAVRWETPAEVTTVDEGHELHATARWLAGLLSEGELSAGEVLRQAREAGHTPAMLRTARRKAGVQIRRDGFGAEGRWVWSLSTETGAAAGAAGQTANGRQPHGGFERLSIVRASDLVPAEGDVQND